MREKLLKTKNCFLDLQKIIEAYRCGSSLRGIAKKYSVSHHTIGKMLKKNGVFVYSNIEWIKKYRHSPLSSEHKDKLRDVMIEKHRLGIAQGFKKGNKYGSCKRTAEQRIKYSLCKIGNKHPSWRGGIMNSGGYKAKLSPNHPNANKTGRGYVMVHRLIAEKHLERFLTRKEVVHHINGIRADNRIENLIVLKNSKAHSRIHFHPELLSNDDVVLDGRKIK